jgi:hypothetical protein
MDLTETIDALNVILRLRRGGKDAEALKAFGAIKASDLPKFNIDSGIGIKLNPASFVYYVKHDWDNFYADDFIRRVTGAIRQRRHMYSRKDTYKPPCRQDPEYRAWERMKRRCYDKNFDSYPNYGGRGITVYEPWHNDYEAFLAHVGKRPSSDYSLDRIENNGNYEPGNVRWATSLEQKNNRRSVHKVTFNGETLSLTGWERRTGISRTTLKKRLKDHPPEVVLAGTPGERRAFKERAARR